MTLYTQQAANIRKTWLLMAMFLSMVIGIGWVFSQIYQNPGILYIAVFLSIVMNILGYWFADKVALALHRAHPVKM